MESDNSYAEKRLVLENRSEKFKLAAKVEVVELKGNVAKIGKTALAVGTGVLATYLLYKMFFGNKRVKSFVKAKNNYQPENTLVVQRVEESPLVRKIKEQIVLFLIAIAKQKLQEYIDGLGKHKND
ncbi:MAG: hypothetical protein RL711_3 [Bacteroidota bacterium]|jgi:hypothetical protein